MLRFAATVALVLVTAGALAACDADDRTAKGDRGDSHTTTNPVRTKDRRLTGRTFTPAVVTACLERARTSVGVALVSSDPYVGRLTAPKGILEFWLGGLSGDAGLTMGFVGDDGQAGRFARRALAFESERMGADHGRSLVFRQRGNVVFYYSKATGTEVVRIAQGCLGGPPYAGNGAAPQYTYGQESYDPLFADSSHPRGPPPGR